jgi:cell division protein FtsL
MTLPEIVYNLLIAVQIVLVVLLTYTVYKSFQTRQRINVVLTRLEEIMKQEKQDRNGEL